MFINFEYENYFGLRIFQFTLISTRNYITDRFLINGKPSIFTQESLDLNPALRFTHDTM